MRLPFVSLVFTILAVASVLLCAILDQPLLALAPLVLLFLYVLVAFWLSAGDHLQLEWFADHVYFLGYVSTITAFAGVVLRAWLLDEGFDDPKPVLLMGGIALLTTVAGLVGMTFIRSYARMLEDTYGAALRPLRSMPPARARREPAGEVAAEPPEREAADAPARETSASAAPESVPGLVAVKSPARDAASEELRHASEQATMAIASLDAQLRSLNDGLAQLQEIVSRGNPEVETLVRNVREVQSVLDGFVAYLGSHLEADAPGARPARAAATGRTADGR